MDDEKRNGSEEEEGDPRGRVSVILEECLVRIGSYFSSAAIDILTD